MLFTSEELNLIYKSGNRNRTAEVVTAFAIGATKILADAPDSDFKVGYKTAIHDLLELLLEFD